MRVSYQSTRGKTGLLSFEQVVLGGLAQDNGLFVPNAIPQFSAEQIEKMRTMTFAELAFEVISSYVSEDDVPTEALADIINRSFEKFRSPEVTPVVKCNDMWILELFHGPTFAFKDVALQFLGNLFEFFLTRGRIQRSMTILGATSGDTGSAAIHGLRGKANVQCFIMFPTGKVTEIQERQMTTVADENIHCIGIDGDFDDTQALVKTAFADEAFRTEVHLGAVNSINWARVLAQITYYFYAYLRVTDHGSAPTQKVSFAVPTGNFGDILAGYYAQRMGLPVVKLMVCTNQNDVLHRFLQSGEYRRVPAEATLAPSMDISVSSNFERYLFYLADESGEQLAQWMETFERTGVMQVSASQLQRARQTFCSYAASGEVIVDTMRNLYEREGYLVCPHTATAVAGVQDALRDTDSAQSVLRGSVHICLATAHPAKFEEAVLRATQGSSRPTPARPTELQELFALQTRKASLPNSLKEVETFVRARLL